MFENITTPDIASTLFKTSLTSLCFVRSMRVVGHPAFLKAALKSDRKGIKKCRDYFVFVKMAWTESMSYFGIVQTILLFTALTPQAVENINGVLTILHIPYQFPVASSSVVVIIFISFIILFGLVAYRFFGLARRAYEITSLYSPTNFLLYNEIQELKKEIEELKKKWVM